MYYTVLYCIFSKLHPTLRILLFYTVFCCSVLYCSALYFIVLHSILLCCTVFCCSVLYFTALYYIYCSVLYSTVLHCILLFFIIFYCVALYFTALCYILVLCSVLYCSVLYFTVLYCTGPVPLAYNIQKSLTFDDVSNMWFNCRNYWKRETRSCSYWYKMQKFNRRGLLFHAIHVSLQTSTNKWQY